MRLEKDQIKRTDKRLGGHGKERKRRRKERSGIVKDVSLLSQGRSLEE